MKKLNISPLRFFIWALLAVNVALIGVYVMSGRPIVAKRKMLVADGKELPILANTPAFSFVTQSGSPMSNEMLRGKIWVGSFIYLSCPSQCPTLVSKLALFQNKLPSEVYLLSFSVDPEHDTIAALKTYAESFKADLSKWMFLTGDKQWVLALQKAWMLGSSEADPALHSLRLILVDELGQVRGYYDSDEPKAMKQLLADIQQLQGALYGQI